MTSLHQSFITVIAFVSTHDVKGRISISVLAIAQTFARFQAIYMSWLTHKSLMKDGLSVSLYTCRITPGGAKCIPYGKRNDWRPRRLHVANENRLPPVIDFLSTRWSLEPVEIRLAFRTATAFPWRQIVVIKFHHGEREPAQFCI